MKKTASFGEGALEQRMSQLDVLEQMLLGRSGLHAGRCKVEDEVGRRRLVTYLDLASNVFENSPFYRQSLS